MRITVLLVLSLVLGACATPIKTERVGADEVFLSVNANVLSHQEPSFVSRTTLHRAALTEAYDDDPRAALAELHRAALKIDRRERLFALAELCLLTARDEDDRALNLASAAYAYLYLLGEADDPLPHPYGRSLRVACEIYNRALAEAFRTDDGLWHPVAGVYDMPVGQVIVDVPDDQLRVGTQSFDRFRLCADFEVHGLTGRLHQSGLGTTLIADAPDRKTSSPTEISAGMVTAATAFLEVHGELEDAQEAGLLAELTLLHTQGSGAKQLRGQAVPLELDATTPLAYGLAESKWWDFELGSFLSPETATIQNGLTLLTPYVPGRIPVVFVHGTASSPARWIEMINELGRDRLLRQNYSVWLFTYKTSAPILMSAQTLRHAITERVAQIDPEGRDPALRRMLVVGHSQGGLLTRLCATHSGNHFWDAISDSPFEDLKAPPEMKTELRKVLFFEPVPEVESVVFISTPHRGSFLSEGILRSIADWVISIPKKTLQVTQNVVARNTGLIRPDVLGTSPTAVDNMSPGNQFLVALEAAPMANRIDKHSIIACLNPEDDIEDRDDGVVAFSSAQIDDVTSEVVIRSGHSVQGNPLCIDEVRRILREHLQRAAPVETE